MAVDTQSPVRPGSASRSEDDTRGCHTRCDRLALGLALVALSLAVLGAILPAIPKQATYVWPPTQLSGQPSRSWFAPLLLARGTAAAVSATVPCRPGAVLSGAGPNPIALATARNAGAFGALQVRWFAAEQRMVVRVGSKILARMAAPPGGCTLAIRMDGVNWAIRRSTGGGAFGRLPTPVGVTGLLTQIDLRSRPPLRVEVTPPTEDTRASVTQTVLRVLAVIGLLAALALALMGGRMRLRRPRLRNPLPVPGLPDLFVGLTLLTWWIVGPPFYDDGWVAARQSNSLQSGGFSVYYDHHAANLPLGTWLEWLQRLVVAHTRTLLWQRIPSIACLVLLWLVVRAALAALIGRPPRRGNSAWWSAAAAYAVGAAALGVTLRPEPVNALLVGGVLLSMIGFARRPSAVLLAVAAGLAGLAITEHPEGLLALGPILASLPRIVEAVRSRTIRATTLLTIVVAGVAWVAVIEFIGSDFHHRLGDVRLLSSGYNNHGVTDEWLRYTSLGYGDSPLRRTFVAICQLCALSAFVPRDPSGGAGRRLPAASVLLGLMLLAFVPSKWVWHFGALMGVCGVAAGVEVDRWRDAARYPKRFPPLRAKITLAAGLLAVGWSLFRSRDWGLVDLRTLSWQQIPFSQAGAVLMAGGLVIGLVTAIDRVQGGRPANAVPIWRRLSIGLPLALIGLMALPMSMFAADALATSGFTTPRQNVDALLGRPTCGLADDTLVPDVRTISAAPRIGGGPASTPTAAVSAAPTAGVSILRAGIGSAPGTRVWYRLPPRGHNLGLYVGGVWSRSPSITLSWGRLVGTRVVPVASTKLRLASLALLGPDPARWTLIAGTSLPAPPPGAVAVAVRLDAAGGPRVAATSPVWYSTAPLAARVRQPAGVVLLSPFLVEYVPCARMPVVEYGVGQAPGMLVDTGIAPSATNPNGPFAGIPDLYDVIRLPVVEPPDLRSRIAVYDVEVDGRDAIAPAVLRAGSG